MPSNRGRIVVAQIGARKNYVTAEAFARHGMLARLYSDFYLRSDVTGRSLITLSQVLSSGFLSACAARRSEGVPDELVHSFPSLAVEYEGRKRFGARQGDLASAYLWGGAEFCRRTIEAYPARADGVYAFSSAALELFRFAKNVGQMCILDHETPPALLEHKLVEDQRRRYPHWSASPDVRALDKYTHRQRAEAELADLVICPSTFGRRLAIEGGAPPENVRVVPFAVHSRFLGAPGPKSPHDKLRVLFVGNDAIRKGLPDLTKALSLLKSRVGIEARGVGAWALRPEGRKEARTAMDVLGSVPRSEIASHYQWADVFVLPTVSDTLGVVLLEALAAGLPVITTPNSGGPDVIREGVNGFIVPIHDPEAIAEKLEYLAMHREVRTAMSLEARRRADDFTLETYGRHIASVVHEELVLDRRIKDARPSLIPPPKLDGQPASLPLSPAAASVG